MLEIANLPEARFDSRLDPLLEVTSVRRLFSSRDAGKWHGPQARAFRQRYQPNVIQVRGLMSTHLHATLPRN